MDESTNARNEGLDQPISRRSLLKYVLLGVSAAATAGGVLAPIIGYLWPPKGAATEAGGPVAVASAADLPVGRARVYSVASKPVIIIHTADGFHALSAVCTHLACIVGWNAKRGVIACPCHAGFFTVNGDVISGPPPAPLKKYQVQVQGGQIYVATAQG
jgi:cytochrome b6-f complex iron-sulfur subunit